MLDYTTDSMTVNHCGLHVWGRPYCLLIKDLFCRFRKIVEVLQRLQKIKLSTLFQWQSKRHGWPNPPYIAFVIIYHPCNIRHKLSLVNLLSKLFVTPLPLFSISFKSQIEYQYSILMGASKLHIVEFVLDLNIAELLFVGR